MRIPWAGMRWRLHPARTIVVVFAVAALIGTVLLALPLARAGDGSAPLVTAVFTSVSAVSVTGLVVVDTPTYWSGFGEVVIIGLVQLGGFGIMTLASLLVIVLSRRINLRTRLVAQAETRSLELGDVRRVVRGVALTSLAFEGAAAVILAVRLWAGYDLSPGTALYRGVFHAISGFNNAGFALYSDNMMGFVGDPIVCGTLIVLAIAGGLGFPVLFELRRELLVPRGWSLHTRLVVYATAVLIGIGTVAMAAIEWGNQATLGTLSVPERLLASVFAGVMAHSGGFNTVDVAGLDDASLLVGDAMMFIGAAPAGTGGGIKVTTAVILVLIVWAEARGEPSVNAFGRRLPETVLRQAIAVTLVSLVAVTACTLALLLMTEIPLDPILFEVTSAFGTVGLSTGITDDLPTAGQLLIVVLMFVGRIGPMTLAAALALRERRTLYRLPEERPIVG